jgi:hypothetical protein
MTEIISDWMDGNQQDGDSGRTGPLLDLASGKNRARGVFLHTFGESPASHHPFCPP